MAIFGLITKAEHERALNEKLESIKAELASQYPAWLLQTAGGERYNLPDPSVYGNQADLYRKLSWIAQAIDITAGAAAPVKFSVGRVVAEKEPKDIPNHPFEMLLAHPNSLDSRFEFIYATIAMYKLNGNAYWYLNRSGGEGAPPDEIWFIPPHTITPVPDENLYLRGYLYYPPGTGLEIPLEPWQIVHFRRFNPFSRFVGLSLIESLGMQASGDLGMVEWNTRLFKENNARLPGILMFEQFIDGEMWQKIKDDTREAAKKRELLMLRGVGKGGATWLQNAVSQKEMEFLSGRTANKKEIQDTLAPGLSTWLSENSTLANSTSNRAAFNELTLFPMLTLIGEKITNEILPAYPGRPLVGKFEDVRIADKQMLLAEQVEYSKSHTVAEVREKYYGDGPLGDERDDMLPAQVSANSGAPAEQTAATPQPQGQNPPMTPDDGEPEGAVEETGESNNLELLELDRYERKALKNIGKNFEFDVRYLAPSVKAKIVAGLPACRDAESTRVFFAQLRRSLKPQKKDAASLLEGLKLAIQYAESRNGNHSEPALLAGK